MALATMRTPLADNEHIPHEIADHGVRETWAAAFVASAKADGADARCIVRSDCFVATSTGTDGAVFDLDTYICEANASTGLAIDPFDVLAKSTRGRRQSPTPVLLDRMLSFKSAYGNKLTEWFKADKPHYPWMASLPVPDGGTEASTPLPSGRHANIGAFVSHTETETKDTKAQVATHNTQFVATQTAVQDLTNMLKPVLTQLASEVNDIKVGVGHTQAGLMMLRAERNQMQSALESQSPQLPPAGSAAAAAEPLPAPLDADMTTPRDAEPLPASGAGAASAAHPGGWRQVLSNAVSAGNGAITAGATARVPLGLGNAHDQQAAAGATPQLPRPKTGGAPPCAEHCDGAGDDEYGALWTSGLPLTVPGPPRLCRNAAICGLQTFNQRSCSGFCYGACAHTYGSEHDGFCRHYMQEQLTLPAVHWRSLLARFSGALTAAVESSTKAALGAPPVGAPPSQESNDGLGDDSPAQLLTRSQ